ncbi:MAG: glycosyltransferase family 61 protein [Alphaproteobacteria bacterium]|nr:glycosyltransferase family 61 protein [Alphaproteobacteria bacterium]
MSVRIFSSKLWQVYFKIKTYKQHTQDIHKDKIVKNGIIANEHSHGYGVFDDKLKFVMASAQKRGKSFQLVPKISRKNIEYIDKDVVFLGGILNHFGDFLINNLVRTHCLLDKKYSACDIVFVNDKNIAKIPSYIYTFLELLGVSKDRIIILEKTTQFKNVFVPDQGWRFPVCTSNKCEQTFNAMVKNLGKTTVTKYEKIYLSRDALQERRTHGEKYIADIFRKNGFKIIYPETLPLKKQIDLVSHCRVLAGCAGTALHLALFMKPGGCVIQIKRNSRLKDNAATQYIINKTKKLDSVFISGSIEKRSTIHCTYAPQIIGLNKYMRKFFDEYNYQYDKKSPDIDAQTLNEYNIDLINYSNSHGNETLYILKRKFIKLSACFIPGREHRARYRKLVKSLLKVD